MRSWIVIPVGGQSSFDHVHVESLKKILNEILVCHTWGRGGQSSFDHAPVESLKKILGEILFCHTFNMCMVKR